MTTIWRTCIARGRWELYALLWCTPLLTLLAGCGPGPAAPSASIRTTAVTADKTVTSGYEDPDERLFVFLAQLFSYEDPNEHNVLGTVNLRLRQAIGDPNLYNVAGIARLVPREEPYVAGIVLNEGSGSVINFSRPEIGPRSLDVVFPVTTTISSTVATRMIGDPDVFVVVFSTASGPVAIGRLKLIEPPEPD